jgi:AcrR family transcriptional regulator
VRSFSNGKFARPGSGCSPFKSSPTHPLEEVSTNHIAQKTGISIGRSKYYPNKDSILADLSLMYMQKDAELVGGIFDKYQAGQWSELLDELIDALMAVHMQDARVRGVVYQNLGRLGLVSEAQNTRQQIQAKGVSVFPRMEPGLTWVTSQRSAPLCFPCRNCSLSIGTGISLGIFAVTHWPS